MTPKKTVPIRSKKGKLAGSVSLGGKSAPSAKVAGAKTTKKASSAKTVKHTTNLEKLKLVNVSNFPKELLDTFPDEMVKSAGVKMYVQVAKSMADFKGDLSEWRIPSTIGPKYHDRVGIWTAMNALGIWKSKDIEGEVADRGESVNLLEETLQGYLTEAYEWAYDALMEYVGGFSYVTNHYGAWGKWVKYGTEVEEDDLVFTSPAAKRAEWERQADARRTKHNAQFKH